MTDPGAAVGRPSAQGARRMMAVWVAVVFALAVLPDVASAHQDPPGCSGASIGQDLLVNPSARAIRECEPFTAETTLTWLGDCLIGGGDLVIGLADPADPLNPAADEIVASVPVGCLGNATVTAEGCAPGQDNSISIPATQIFARPQDVAQGYVTVRARWSGILHQSASNQPQANAREVVIPIDACPADTFCTDTQCLYDAQSGTASCQTTDISATVCPDNLFCSDVVCNDDIDQCVTTSVAAQQCPDNLFCSDVTCDEATDSCVTTDISGQQCPDPGLDCVSASCNEALDRCDQTIDESACDDGNACTSDSCDPQLGCVHDSIPDCVPCVTAGDCDDGDACTTDTCEGNVCVATPIPGCVPCVTAGDCDDGDACTTDTCEGNVCVATPIPGCVPCVTAGDCDDGNACTTDTCEGNVCVATPIPGCVSCVTAGDCNDGDACTTDTCEGNVCVSTPIAECIPCTTDGECDDGDPCTTDACVDNACSATPIDGCRPCEVPSDCADGDICTIDLCVDGVCVARPAFLAKVRLQFGNQANINGPLAVNDLGGFLRLGKTVVMPDGTSVSADLVRIGDGSQVWAVYANQFAHGRDVLFGPTGLPTLPVMQPFCSLDDFVCGTQSVKVDSRTISPPLAPGTYGVLRVYNGATLQLQPGTFTFCEIRTGRGGTILTSGPTTINVVGNVRLSNWGALGPQPGSPTPTLNVLGSQVRVSAQSTMQAYLTAPGALLTMGRNSILTGSFCVYRTRSDKRVTLFCPPDEALGSPSGAFLD